MSACLSLQAGPCMPAAVVHRLFQIAWHAGCCADTLHHWGDREQRQQQLRHLSDCTAGRQSKLGSSHMLPQSRDLHGPTRAEQAMCTQAAALNRLTVTAPAELGGLQGQSGLCAGLLQHWAG